MTPLRIVFIGLSITSSWGNGHATTYRGLVRELAKRGHGVLFLERDVPYYARNRDLPEPPFGSTRLYGTLDELRDRYSPDIAEADAVIVGSYVPDGIAVGDWVLQTARGERAFYDIDTPITLESLARGTPDVPLRRASPPLRSVLELHAGAGARSSALGAPRRARRAALLLGR